MPVPPTLRLQLGLLIAIPTLAHAEGPIGPDLAVGTPEIRLESVASVPSGVVIHIRNAGDGSGRLFVSNGSGQIYIVRNDVLEPTPFLDLPVPGFLAGRAMSSLAFHPGFSDPLSSGHRKLYVITGEAPGTAAPDFGAQYAAAPEQNDDPFDNVLYEFEVDTNDPDIVDVSTKRELLRVFQPRKEHNINDMVFDANGHLLLAIGDGGNTGSGDFHENAQDTTVAFGKILRIDVDGTSYNGRYDIPASNPFAVAGGANVAEIFAWGMRNPWRIHRDPQSDEIYVGENGHDDIEEVDRIVLAGDYGWATKEGSFLYLGPGNGVAPDADPVGNGTVGMIDPAAEWDHDLGNPAVPSGLGSIIGGAVYRSANLIDLRGHYVMADWVGRVLLAMNVADDSLQILPLASDSSDNLSGDRPITFGADERGELYLGTQNRRLLRITQVTVCSNGEDDDGDGLTDFPADDGCATALGHSEFADCDDGLDNDADGLVDHPADPECRNRLTWSSEDPDVACNDGLDNDADGHIDHPADPHCTAPWGESEAPAPACGLGAELGLLAAGGALLSAARRRSKAGPADSRVRRRPVCASPRAGD